MIDLIPVTNSKLERIQSEQQALRVKLLAVQFTVEAQRITVQNSLKNITTKGEFGARLNETERKLRAENSELKNQLQLLRTKMEDQQSAIKTKLDALLEPLSKTITKDDFQAKLNGMEAQLNMLQSTLSKIEDTKSNARKSLQNPSHRCSRKSARGISILRIISIKLGMRLQSLVIGWVAFWQALRT